MPELIVGIIDTNIELLVDEINLLDGLITIGSCGGHDNPEPGQHAAGTWFVTFYVVGLAGKASLQTLSEIVNQIDNISIEHHELDEGVSVVSPKELFDDWYSIEGINCIDPIAIRDGLEATVKWVSAFVRCEYCNVEHMSVHPISCPVIECPQCGEMTKAPHCNRETKQ